jgi:hypothetical protein
VGSRVYIFSRDLDMSSKLLAPSKASFSLISLFVILSASLHCSAQTEETQPVQLDDFYAGVYPRAQRRYQMKDIKVGDVSVKHLFKKIPRPDPAWYPGGYLRTEPIPLVIEGGKEWRELRQVLIAHPDCPLEVVLQDAWDPIWSRLSRWDSEHPYGYSISIPVTFKQTPCDEVTRLIYEKIISKLMKEENETVTKEGQANRRLDINEVFDKLRVDNELEAYIDKLDPVTNPCVETIRLLKLQTEEKTTGFGSGEYTLHKKIQDGLKLIISGMETEPDWWKSELSLKVTGFTDEVEVTKSRNKKLEINNSGVSTDAWSRINNRFEVYYSGCQDNKLNVKGRFVYLSFTGSRSEKEVGLTITNNCELGAVRAYVAMVYLTSELGRISPEDSYATGGIYSGPDAKNTKNDPEKRRVHVEFVIRAAKMDKSTQQ